MHFQFFFAVIFLLKFHENKAVQEEVSSNAKAPLIILKTGSDFLLPELKKQRGSNELFKFNYTPGTMTPSRYCPIHGKKETLKHGIQKIFSQWEHKPSLKEILIPKKDYYYKECEEEFHPSIHEIPNKRLCYEDGPQSGYWYGVGYWFYDEKEKKLRHGSIYELCVSQDTQVLYTHHQFSSISLLSESAVDIDIKPDSIRKSKFESNDEYENKIRYQSVLDHDLPIFSYKTTSYFDFNILPLTDVRMKIHLERVDYYIRGTLVVMNVCPRIISGIRLLNGLKYRWRVIHSETYGTIAIITEIDNEIKSCKKICPDISKKSGWTLLSTAEYCTYACEVNEELKQKFKFDLSEADKIFERQPRSISNIDKLNLYEWKSEVEDPFDLYLTDDCSS